MYADKEKVILTDCDGVVLDWKYAFMCWMDSHGHKMGEEHVYDVSVSYGIAKPEAKRLVKMFNESAAIGFLPPLRDAIHYVRMLHERHGYVFHAITSLSKDDHACELRTQNLKRLFGTAFEKFVYLDTGADKDEALSEYKDSGCYWIEDKQENADVGSNLGLNSLLVRHHHNVGYKGPAKIVGNWKEIYETITG